MNNALVLSSILLWVVVLINLSLTLAIIRKSAAMNPIEGISTRMPTLAKGSPAPPFNAEMLQGGSSSSKQYTQKNVMYLFVGPKCEPCHKIMPKVNSLAQRAKLSGVDIVLVSDDGQEEASKFQAEVQTDLPIIIAPRGKNSFIEDYKVAGTPFYCYVEKNIVQASGFLDVKWDRLVEQWH